MAKAKVQKPEPPLDPTDPGPIPDSLLVKNRKPLTPEQQAKLDAAKKAAIEQAYDPKRWDKPKSMSDEDYDAWKNRQRLDKQDKMQERFAQLKERKKKIPKAEAPKDTFRLRDLSREAGFDPYLARAVARANKDRLKPLESFGKYVYPNSVKEQVSKIIQEGLAKKKAKPEKVKVKRAPKAKPGSERMALKHTPPSAKKKRKR